MTHLGRRGVRAGHRKVSGMVGALTSPWSPPQPPAIRKEGRRGQGRGRGRRHGDRAPWRLRCASAGPPRTPTRTAGHPHQGRCAGRCARMLRLCVAPGRCAGSYASPYTASASTQVTARFWRGRGADIPLCVPLRHSRPEGEGGDGAGGAPRRIGPTWNCSRVGGASARCRDAGRATLHVDPVRSNRG